MDGGEIAIRAQGLRKRYRDVDALVGVDLAVRAGSVLGLLGPNGAGKTTTVRVLATLLEPDDGRAEVAGFDVRTAPHEVRRRIGLAGQYAALDEVLTGYDNLVLIGRLLHLGRAGARQRADELLERFRLGQVAHRPVRTLSGGQRRRLDLASCLVMAPPVLFLDEPTTGLDPTSRQELWLRVRELVNDGTTVLLTTQYLEEADRLADQIVVVDGGRVVADGTPDELKRTAGREWLDVALGAGVDPGPALAALAGVLPDAGVLEPARGSVAVPVPDGLASAASVADALHVAGIEVTGFALRRPTLDDVFARLTGTSRDGEPASP